MKFTSEQHLPWGRIVERWTEESACEPGGGLTQAENLDRIVRAIDTGELDHATLVLLRPWKLPLRVTRELLASTKASGSLNIPRDGHFLKNWIEPLIISKDHFRQWATDRHKLPRFWFGDEGPPLATTPNDRTVKPTGRPSRETEITEAYEHLRDHRQIDFNKAQNAVFDSIRQHISGNTEHKRGDGLSDETIRNYIAPIFRQNRDTQKL